MIDALYGNHCQFGSCLWAQDAVCPRSSRENELIVSEDPRCAGARESVIYFESFVYPESFI